MTQDLKKEKHYKHEMQNNSPILDNFEVLAKTSFNTFSFLKNNFSCEPFHKKSWKVETDER